MKLNLISLACATLLAVGLSMGVGAGPIVDSDGDGLIDELDNCTIQANPPQRDTDTDGYGNFCDPDFDQDFAVALSDFDYFLVNFTFVDELADLDGDGAVALSDFDIFLAKFTFNPGPSGLICAGSAPCIGIQP